MIVPVLLSGGSGTRLWPLSRKSFPKQFVPFAGEYSLFQASARRLTGNDFTAPLVLTNSDFRFVVTEQLSEIDVDPGAVLIEPEGRNTAPAILAAALWQEKIDDTALMLVVPSDHVIPDTEAFLQAISAGAPPALDGAIVTLGITPGYAETGYGYLELGDAADTKRSGARPLERFVEKPDAVRAAEMLASGRFLWNAGIFLFSVKTILAAFRIHAPQLFEAVEQAIATGFPDLGFFRLAPEPWSGAENISIDYAVMEKANNLQVVPYAGGWSDLGGWDAVWREGPRDASGVGLAGPATAIDCEDTLLRSEDDGVELVGLGLKNVIAVATPDAVLVADKDRAQDVKQVVAALRAKQAKQAEQFPKDHRPWGWFESLAAGSRFQVKRIVVQPGASLSLQSHHHRAEHWIVVEGTAKVTIGEAKQLVTENQSVYIPLGTVHRLENPGMLPMILIEVQTGAYLGEDDIIRYEDAYAREAGT